MKLLAEIREWGIGEAEAKLKESRAELAKERALAASGTRSENPGKIRKIRKTIARILTIINEKKTTSVEKGDKQGNTEKKAKVKEGQKGVKNKK